MQRIFKLRSTGLVGCWHSNISNKHVTVTANEQNMYVIQRLKIFFFNYTSTHSNQQLAISRDHFDCKKFDPENFYYPSTWYLVGRHAEISATLCIL